MFLHSSRLTDAGFRHAFFTRDGGVSSGPYRSLNFSYAVGDERANVDENFERASALLGVPRARVFFASQVHGDAVLELRGDEAHADVLQREADAVVSGGANLACAVRTADCVPILLADPLTGRAAAVHAGWRGLECRVLAAAAQRLGRVPSGWLAAIGPHISVGAFEVSEDVALRLQACCPETPVVVRAPGKKPHIDLLAITRAQLLELGLKEQHIDFVGGCTLLDAERFFSFRRDGKVSGRHLSAIVPRA